MAAATPSPTPSSTPSPSDPVDLIVYGATSFVGRLVVEHLAERLGSGDVSWAVAGRNRAKLEAILAEVGVDVPIVVADAADRTALDAMVAATGVVISTVGPYALYGSELVAAVAAAGVDYCDLTGEPQWVQRMINAHQATAEASGARILTSCGFDSIPSDLGVLYTQERALELSGRVCERVAMRVKAARGGASGGTLASGINVIDELAADRSLRTVLANPYALAPAGRRDGVRQPNVTIPRIDDASGDWIAPFVMASINTKVVHRSNALLDYRWGRNFRYDEAMAMGPGPIGLAKASAVAGGLGGFMAAATVGPIRSLLKNRVLPQPGSGPDEEARLNGFYDLRFHGHDPDRAENDGWWLQTRVVGDRDPGYGSTARMLGETALALLESRGDEQGVGGGVPGGGLHTPASALGTELIGRLEANAGLVFSVIEPGS